MFIATAACRTSSVMLLVVLVALLCPSSLARASDPLDVVVYGATPAGVCAAVGAARQGAVVALVEPSRKVGGMSSSGLSFSDSNQMVRALLGGLFEEFHRRIEENYRGRGVMLPYSVSRKDHSRWVYEPHVAERVADAMLAEAGVKVITGQTLESVEMSGGVLRALRTHTGSTFRGKIFVDASYEGDLLAAAGVAFVIGREGRKEFGESLAGRQFPKPGMAISPFDDAGRLLPLLTGTDSGPSESGDRHVMTYSFRLCLTADAENRVPLPAPDNYDPAKFEALRRYLQQDPDPPFLIDLYPLVNGKVDANNSINKQFSLGFVGAADGWCDAGPAERERIFEAHRQYTLELFWFLSHDPVVPQEHRERLALYGLAKDEFTDTGNWPPLLYVREGRRMRGEYVLTQADIREKPTKSDAVAVLSFPIDSHDCQRLAAGTDMVINEGTIYPVHVPGTRHGHVYQVPYRCLTPKAAECTNLLVPVAVSATHVAYSSLRVEPSWMVLGESAGIAAAMAARLNCAVQQVPIDELQDTLRHAGQIVDLPPQHLPEHSGRSETPNRE